MLDFLQVAFDRIFSPELQDVACRWKIDLVKVKSLGVTLAKIKVLYDEAEVKQLTSDDVKRWLHRLKQLLYDAEDILDEYATELLRLKLESTGPHQTQQVQEFKRFGSKVKEIIEKLKSAEQQGVALGLNSRLGPGSSRHMVFSERPPTGPFAISSKVFGRKEDKDEIVKWLFETPSSTDNNFSVLSIVGIGGSGKTTLAQLVYNDPMVENAKSYFHLKAWVCVSEDFDVVRLTKEILEAVTQSSQPFTSLSMLQMKLKDALCGKRFVFVLDDMWNQNSERWDALTSVFAFGERGSKILVTTRSKSVSKIVRTNPDYDIKGLPEEHCFALFRRHALIDGNSSDTKQKMKAFGEKIMKRCWGLPLAVMTLAGLLRGKSKDSEWDDILKNEIWDLRNSEILPSLMLSYHHLTPPLKRCFAYCALFPKDYVFHKIELVMLWIAEGFVQPSPEGRKRLEDIGSGYFDELFMRCFFESSDCSSTFEKFHPFGQPTRLNHGEDLFSKLSYEFHVRSFFESSNDTGSRFVMHDLIHDLAQYVSGGIYCRREDDPCDNPSQVLTTTRHLSFLTKYCNVDAMESEAMKRVRTLLDLTNHLQYSSIKELLPTMKCQFQFIRVLRVRCDNILELPYEIGMLKHLRLLDISFCYIERLPDSITSLVNLQVLVLTGCWKLKELPKNMGKYLVNLRHLLLPVGMIHNDSLDQMPLIVVGNQGREAFVANFMNMPHLLGLRLRWSAYESENSFGDLGRDEKVEEDVLDQLQPHTNLEVLWIQHYGGTRFPSWIQDPHAFSKLENVSLLNCHKCIFLPHLWQLPLLKHLVISGLNAIKIVGSDKFSSRYGSSSNKQFQSLETLHIRSMGEWEQWLEQGDGQFPRLYKLSINLCPKLKMLIHQFPALDELEIGDCEDLKNLPQHLDSVQQLRIKNCQKLVLLPSLLCIKTLTLDSCTYRWRMDKNSASTVRLSQ
ncbi:hypothetical protein NE237_003232 [Protea cynaroides]|uniref:Disease resistance RPP13-like protein 1 n=1 Tax=Protea cynaroides TaxID=273540 RepID=A0A9Q0KGF9_9MAGN|nr:hypothetical protein NE237_003232 [Protea cynaroides]